jgi:hypothetical protein
MMVTITNAHVAPPPVRHDGVVLAKYHPSENASAAAALKGKTLPAPHHDDNKVPSVAVIVSIADQRIVVVEHDRTVAEGKAFIANPGKPLGSHVFVLMGSGTYGQGLLWQVISHNATPGGVVSGAHDELIQRISGEPSVVHAMKAGHEPGHGACPDRRADHGENRSGAGFSIITADER